MTQPPSQELALRGRVALITGVSRPSGIGYSIARELRSKGADCFLQSWAAHDVEQPWGFGSETLAEVIRSLETPGRRMEHLSIDLADPSAPGELIDSARAELGHIDILIANHARSSHQALEELTYEELEHCYRVNAIASLLLIKEWAAQHDDSRAGGRAIVMSSGQHLGPMTRELPYASSKAAAVDMVPGLAAHLSSRGVTVNAVNPGPTDTGWADQDTHARVLEKMPFGRWGEPADAARLIGWLCSDEGRWITGQILNSEGGFNRFA